MEQSTAPAAPENNKPRVGDLLSDAEGRPAEEWVRGRCPDCGSALVSELLFTPGTPYAIRWECWNSRPDPAGVAPTCSYQVKL